VSYSVGFQPIVREDARVLILGTLPGAESLAKQQYYAKPQNSFWKIMGELAGAFPALPYEERLERLKSHRIAVWDVCAAADRAGSLDSAIKAPEPNDFAGFFATHAAIDLICFNGQPAGKLFDRFVRPGLPEGIAVLPRFVLPSTSPAHAGMRFEEKLERWRDALGGRLWGI
jgi:TDG/mug DNA glycosylase family protein